MIVIEIEPELKEKFKPQIVCATLKKAINRKERTQEFQEFVKEIVKKIKAKLR